MRKTSRTAVLIAGALLFSTATSADIVVSPFGEPLEGNSWWIGLTVSSAPDVFDYMAIEMGSAGYSFESPAMGDVPPGAPPGDFGSSGWTNTDLYPDYPTLAYATGPPVTQLSLWFKFPDDPRDVWFRLAAYCGTTWRGASRIDFDYECINEEGNIVGTLYIDDEIDWDPGVIPAPGAALLGLVGLGCLARIRRCLA